jgi:pimeloyl-ACP methyl ester carboxylesterase
MQADRAEVVKGYRQLSELVPANWQTGSVEAEDGTHLHYTRTGGAKPAVLLLHGLQGAGLTWLRTARALEAGYDVVLPDLRGHGRSGRIGAGLSMDLLVADARALVKAIGLARPVVVGHSLGADLAGRFAAVAPTRAAVLVDPALRDVAGALALDPDAPPPWLVPILETLRSLRAQPHPERLVAGLRLLPPGTPPWDEADFVSFVEAQAQFDPAVFRYASGMGYLFQEPAVIARIACPVLLLTARPMAPGPAAEEGAAAFERHWRSGRRVHLADSGHFIPFDRFDRFVTELTRFLNEAARPSESRSGGIRPPLA